MADSLPGGAFNYNINLQPLRDLVPALRLFELPFERRRGVDLRSLKANRSSRCPRDNTALFIGYANDRVVKSGVDTGNGIIYILSFFSPRRAPLGAFSTQFPSLNNNFSYFFIVAFSCQQ